MKRWREIAAGAVLCLLAVSLPTSLFGMQLAVGAALLLFVAGLRRWRRSPMDAPLLLMLGTMALSLVLAPYPPTSFRTATSFWVMFTFVACWRLLGEGADYNRALLLMVITASLAALLGVWQSATGNYPALELMHPGVDPRHHLVPNSNRPAGVGFFFSRLSFAHALSFSFCMALAHAIFSGKPAHAAGWATATLVIAAGIVSSWTRAAWAATFVAAALLVAARLRGWGRIVSVTVIVVAVTVSLAAFPSMRKRLERSFGGRSDWTRLVLWHTAFDLASERPLTGIGYGNFQKRATEIAERRAKQAGYERFGGVVAWAHNNFLSFLAECGLLGCVAFCLVFVSYFRAVFRGLARNSARDPRRMATAWGGVAAVVAFLLIGLFHDNWFDGEVAFNLWFTMAVSLHAATSDGEVATW